MHIIAKLLKPLFLLTCGEAACENNPATDGTYNYISATFLSCLCMLAQGGI